MDYIDREKLLKALDEKRRFLLSTYANGRIFFEVDNAIIKEQPTADVVEVRHGEWRPPLGDNGSGWNCGGVIKQILGCSCCGHFFQNGPYNYCPNCGADMRGVEDAD